MTKVTATTAKVKNTISDNANNGYILAMLRTDLEIETSDLKLASKTLEFKDGMKISNETTIGQILKLTIEQRVAITKLYRKFKPISDYVKK